MRRSLVRFRSSILAGTIVALGGPDGLACSGPGAMRTIRESIVIGQSFGYLSLAIVAVGCILLLGRSARRRIPWIVATLALQPVFWISAGRGDCGYGLRFWSLIATLWTAAAVALALCWPRRDAAGSKRRGWVLSGACAGALVGLPIAALVQGGPGPGLGMDLPLVGAILFGTVLAGGMMGGGLYRRRTEPGRRFTFRLRTLLLLPIRAGPPLRRVAPEPRIHGLDVHQLHLRGRGRRNGPPDPIRDGPAHQPANRPG